MGGNARCLYCYSHTMVSWELRESGWITLCNKRKCQSLAAADWGPRRALEPGERLPPFLETPLRERKRAPIKRPGGRPL